MTTTQHSRPDLATMAGALIALGSVAGGLILEGGSIRDIAQLTAGLMVVGGTLGAVLISTSVSTLAGAFKSLKLVFFDRPASPEQVLEQLLTMSHKARKTNIASLESNALTIEDSFLCKSLNLVVDNTPVSEIRSMMEIELDLDDMRLNGEAKVFETAGGYAPTVGIIGAVLGLIQVMKHLENIDEVGRGIAVSFVATVYGVALANLILLPAAAKLRARAAQLMQVRELILEGAIGIAEGVNTSLLRIKLEPYVRKFQPNKPLTRERHVVAQRRVEPSAA